MSIRGTIIGLGVLTASRYLEEEGSCYLQLRSLAYHHEGTLGVADITDTPLVIGGTEPNCFPI